MKFYITKRYNLLDYDGSAVNDSLEVLQEFDDLKNCKTSFKSILKDIDKGNIIIKLQTRDTKNHGLKTLISEYRKIEKFKYFESEFIALEIIESKKDPKEFCVSDGVIKQEGYIY